MLKGVTDDETAKEKEKFRRKEREREITRKIVHHDEMENRTKER